MPASSGADVFDAHVVEAPEHAPEQAYLPLIRRREIRMAAFRAVGDIT